MFEGHELTRWLGRASKRAAIAMILVMVLTWILAFFLGALAARAENPAWDFEAGYQLAPAPGPYISARANLPLGELGPVGLWLLPEGGVVLGDPAEWYGRVQVLTDTPWATVGGEVRTGRETVTRVFVRFGL